MVITSHLLSFKVNLTSTNTLEHLQLSSVQNLVTALTLVFIDSKPGQVWGFVFFVGRFFFGGAGGFFSVGGYEWKQSIVSILPSWNQVSLLATLASYRQNQQNGLNGRCGKGLRWNLVNIWNIWKIFWTLLLCRTFKHNSLKERLFFFQICQVSNPFRVVQTLCRLTGSTRPKLLRRKSFRSNCVFLVDCTVYNCTVSLYCKAFIDPRS